MTRRTIELQNQLIALYIDLLDAAEDEGISGWHLIKAAEGRVWEARHMTPLREPVRGRLAS